MPPQRDARFIQSVLLTQARQDFTGLVANGYFDPIKLGMRSSASAAIGEALMSTDHTAAELPPRGSAADLAVRT